MRSRRSGEVPSTAKPRGDELAALRNCAPSKGLGFSWLEPAPLVSRESSSPGARTAGLKGDSAELLLLYMRAFGISKGCAGANKYDNESENEPNFSRLSDEAIAIPYQHLRGDYQNLNTKEQRFKGTKKN
jgi:hypothetical protein